MVGGAGPVAGSPRDDDGRGRRGANLAILVTAQGLCYCGTSVDLTLTGIVGLRLAPSPALATLPFALITLAEVLTVTPASMLMARVGRRPVFVAGSVVAAVGGLVSVFAIDTRSFGLFCAGTASVGVYQSCATYYRYAAADEAPPGRRSRAISAVLAGGVAAAVAGPFLAAAGASFLPARYAGSYLLVTVLALASAGVLLLLRLRSDPARRGAPGAGAAEPRRPLRTIAGQRLFLTGVASTSVGFATMMFMMTAAPLAVVSHHHTLNQAAAVVEWHMVGMFAPSLFSGRLVARFGSRRCSLAGAALTAAGVGVAVLGYGQPQFLASLALVGVGWNLMYVAGSTLVTQSYRPSERARAQGAAEGVTAGFSALGSLSAAVVLGLFGWHGLALLVLPPLCLLTLILFAALRSRPGPPVYAVTAAVACAALVAWQAAAAPGRAAGDPGRVPASYGADQHARGTDGTARRSSSAFDTALTRWMYLCGH
jgi:MFS family permease